MANVDVLDVQGKKSGSVELDAALFDVNISIPLVHQVVVAQLAAARQGTQSTKRHGEVSGTGKKPFKQKGTGRARQGSLRAPQMRGGYITHGPKPRDYDQRTPKKMKAAAVRQALTDRARNNRLHVVESLSLGDKPSTKAAQAYLSKFTKQKNVLVVLDRTDEVSYLSLRNLKNVHVIPVDQLNAYDILNSDDLVFTKSAIDEFTANSKKEA
ncbi:MAG: 50S ribosomal protein L4 [Microbacteriaceae bacterium]|jgi:large subunit ribosomal protein L4|nr:50S ribosomal protein L4 [Microbacteriaceae bacterium]NBS60567.1 50S ribosomal protein L4 [Microbacteriaceae bacterium]NDC19739.1 50S ribosomal protein L4 [Microbacteriaceae bacterium]